MSVELLNEIKSFQESQDAKLQRIERQVEGLHAELHRPDAGGGRESKQGDFITAGRRLVTELQEKGLGELFSKTKRVQFVAGSFFPSFEEKALIDSSALGDSTPGVLGSQHIPGFVPLPRRRLTVRDLLRSRPLTRGAMDFIGQSGFTNAASPQTEGSTKGESAMTFTVVSEHVATIAHWVPLSKQAMDDLPELRRFVDETLLYGLKLKEESELLSGDNLGEHLNGLLTQATAFTGAYTLGGDTKLDKLRHAILQLDEADEMCTGFVLSPKDFHDIELIKTDVGGVNTGSYIVGDPLGGVVRVPTLWGRPTVVTRSMATGTFLAGNFAAAMIGDRQDATIDISEEHSDFFTANKIAVRCEERIVLGVQRTTAFIRGAL